LQCVFFFLGIDNDATRESFATIDKQATEAFEASASFQDKLLCLKVSVLSALYLHHYFDTDDAVADHVITEDRVQLLSHVSGLFTRLIDTSDVKSAIAEEFETRVVTTSIWLRLNQQTHTTDGFETLKDIADLQLILGDEQCTLSS
jgi:hypothetical protein